MSPRHHLVRTRYGFRMGVIATAPCIKSKPMGDYYVATGWWRKHLYKVNGYSRRCRRCGAGESMALAT